VVEWREREFEYFERHRAEDQFAPQPRAARIIRKQIAAMTAYASAHAWSYSTLHCSPAYARMASIKAPPTTS